MLKWVFLMKIDENNILSSAKKAFQDSISKVPFIRNITFEPVSSDRDVKPDILVKLELPESTVKILGEVKSQGQPRLAREAVNQLIRCKEVFRDSYGIFIAPYISEKAAEICRSEGIGYLDLSGNCLLSFDKVYIEKEGNPNKYLQKRDLRSLYSPKAERILRVLLNNPGKNWKVQDLADESDVSLGQVSNVKKLLYNREWIFEEKSGLLLVDPKQLLDEWSENYNYRKNEVWEFYSLKGLNELEKSIAEYCKKSVKAYALTGFSGAARLAPSVRYKKAITYISELQQDLAIELSIKPVTSGGNLLVFSPYDDGVYYGKKEYDGIDVVSPIQLYLDLKGFRGRGEEAAEALYDQIIEQQW